MTKNENQTAGQTALKYALLLDYANSNILISPKEGGKFFTSKEAAEAAIEDHRGIGGTGFTIIPFSAEKEDEFLRSFGPMPFIEDEAGLRAALEGWIGGEEHYFECRYANKFVTVYAPFTLIENIAVGVGGEKRSLEYRKYIQRNGWKVTWLKEELTNDIVDTVRGLFEEINK